MLGSTGLVVGEVPVDLFSVSSAGKRDKEGYTGLKLTVLLDNSSVSEGKAPELLVDVVELVGVPSAMTNGSKAQSNSRAI